jgi:hypothetical protein
MRTLLVAATVAIAASVAAFSQPTASAAPPLDVSIQAHPTQFFPIEIGSWQAIGAIDDSGSYIRTYAATSPPNRPFFALGPFREVFVFSGSLGTFTIREEARLTAAGVTGVWEIASGTGAYDNASGHGAVAFDGPSLTLLLTGVISKAG